MLKTGAHEIDQKQHQLTAMTTTTTMATVAHRQSHGGTLYYVVEVPRAEMYTSQNTIIGKHHQHGYKKERESERGQICVDFCLLVRLLSSGNPNNGLFSFHLPCLFSTESGWDNPFRPGGDLSREADEIVNMIKGKRAQPPSMIWRLFRVSDLAIRLCGQAANQSHRPARMAPAQPSATARQRTVKTVTQSPATM